MRRKLSLTIRKIRRRIGKNLSTRKLKTRKIIKGKLPVKLLIKRKTREIKRNPIVIKPPVCQTDVSQLRMPLARVRQAKATVVHMRGTASRQTHLCHIPQATGVTGTQIPRKMSTGVAGSKVSRESKIQALLP